MDPIADRLAGILENIAAELDELFSPTVSHRAYGTRGTTPFVELDALVGAAYAVWFGRPPPPDSLLSRATPPSLTNPAAFSS